MQGHKWIIRTFCIGLSLIGTGILFVQCKATDSGSKQSGYVSKADRYRQHSDITLLRGIVFGYGPFLKESATLEKQASISQVYPDTNQQKAII